MTDKDLVEREELLDLVMQFVLGDRPLSFDGERPPFEGGPVRLLLYSFGPRAARS
jgi:hypothetical protein